MTLTGQIKMTLPPHDVAGGELILWAKMRAGSEKALAQLYQRYLPSLCKHGMYVCRDNELVNDCIHELFSRLWSRRTRISAATNVRFYLSKSLERIIVAQMLRSKKRATSTVSNEVTSASFEQLWIDGESRKECLGEIKKCVKNLPKCQREVILLRFFNDLTYQEISEIMDLQLASVYNLASKAIEQLRKNIQSRAVTAS